MDDKTDLDIVNTEGINHKRWSEDQTFLASDHEEESAMEVMKKQNDANVEQETSDKVSRPKTKKNKKKKSMFGCCVKPEKSDSDSLTSVDHLEATITEKVKDETVEVIEPEYVDMSTIQKSSMKDMDKSAEDENKEKCDELCTSSCYTLQKATTTLEELKVVCPCPNDEVKCVDDCDVQNDKIKRFVLNDSSPPLDVFMDRDTMLIKNRVSVPSDEETLFWIGSFFNEEMKDLRSRVKELKSAFEEYQLKYTSRESKQLEMVMVGDDIEVEINTDRSGGV